MDLHLQRTSLHAIVRNVLIAHKRLCIRNAIVPQINGEAWSETDEKWMTVVLNQIVSNAIKYSKGKPGAKKLTFSFEPHADGGNKLSITDEGVGIVPHDIPRIFDPFFKRSGEQPQAEASFLLFFCFFLVLRMTG